MLPDGGLCGHGQVIPYGQATETIVFGGGCGGSHRTVIASGLNFPTGIAFGPDGNLYVAVNGFGGPPGAGQVVRIALSDYQGQ